MTGHELLLAVALVLALLGAMTLAMYLASKRAVLTYKSTPAAAPMAVQPIVVNPGSQDRLAIAEYRVDAIRRYLEQSSGASAQKLRELFAETVIHADALLKAGRIDVAAHDAMIALVRRAQTPGGWMS